MSPPGNSSGLTTCASVLITMRPAGVQPGGVMALIQQRVGEMARKHLADQARWHAAAAMGHFDGCAGQKQGHSAASMAAIVSARR
jgi:hypothetical protein